MDSDSAQHRSGNQRVSRIALLLLFSSLTAACQPAGEAPVPGGAETAEPAGTTQSRTTQASQLAQASVIEVDLELGPGNFDLTDPRVGLADLTSYRQTLIVSFRGTKDGQGHQWSQTRTFLHDQEPSASMLTIESSGSIEAADPAVIAEKDGDLYQSHRDGGCTSEPGDPGASVLALQEPAGLLGGLLGAEEAGSAPVNNVAAIHYTFDERAMAESGRADTAGEVWVAVDGGHLLKYVRTTTSDAAYFGDGVEGTITWAYDLTRVNQETEIILPPGCRTDAPSMPDSVDLRVLPSWTSFETSSSAAEVRAFYEEQLPGQGWMLSADPLVGGSNELTVYAKDDLRLFIFVGTSDGATRVNILQSTATE